MPPGFPSLQVASDLVWTDELLILVDYGATEAGFKDHDRGEDESGANFEEGEGSGERIVSFGFGGGIGFRVGVGNCVGWSGGGGVFVGF